MHHLKVLVLLSGLFAVSSIAAPIVVTGTEPQGLTEKDTIAPFPVTKRSPNADPQVRTGGFDVNSQKRSAEADSGWADSNALMDPKKRQADLEGYHRVGDGLPKRDAEKMKRANTHPNGRSGKRTDVDSIMEKRGNAHPGGIPGKRGNAHPGGVPGKRADIDSIMEKRGNAHPGGVPGKRGNAHPGGVPGKREAEAVNVEARGVLE